MARLIDAIEGHAAQWEQLLRQLREGTLAHSLAFTGPSGIGKSRVAWALAQALLCERAAEVRPCGECGSCRRVESRQSESVLVLEPSGTQIKLESAYLVLEFLALRRISAARLILVNEAHLLNPQAANALLKVVEEPPPGTHFVFIVPEISQLMPTLRSRSQVLRFAPLADEALALGEEIPPWMLRSARGSFEKLAAFRDEEMDELRHLAFGFLESAIARRREGMEKLMANAKDRETALQAVRFLQQTLRDWALLGTGREIHADLCDRLARLPAVEPRRRVALWAHAQQMESDILGNVDRALLFENFFYRANGVN